MTDNLPVRLTAFVGREVEVGVVAKLLGETRMLTLIGAGGCGKTRLALEVARNLDGQFPDGIWWVDLAPVVDPVLVPTRVASALGVREAPGRPARDAVIDHLRSRHALVIMDNCEHLLDVCAELCSALLASCPDVSVLATSREPVKVGGETSWRVPSLSLPSGPASSEFDSVRLFLDRARHARPDFVLTPANAWAIGEICRRTDGIPLALELAAPLVRALSPETIVAALSESFRLLTGGERATDSRHQTLEASMAWSYALLTAPEQLLLARLSIFAGGFEVGAAEAVCNDELLERGQVLGLLVRLVDRSLVELEPDGRYRLLETIRQFATARLAPTDDAAVRDRHLEHFVNFAEAARQDLESPRLEQALTAVERDLDNIRAAMDHAVASGREEMALRIAGALWLFWLVRGRWREVQRRVELAFTATSAPAAVRATALVAGANVSLYAGDFISARRFSEEGVSLSRASEDPATLARALTWRGWAGVLLYPNQAAPFFEEAISLCRDTGDDIYLVRALNGLGNVAALSDSAAAARTHMREAIDLARRTGNPVGLGHALTNTGIWVSALSGALEEATEQLQEALQLARARGDLLFTALTLYGLALVATFRGEYDAAAEMLDEALATSVVSGTAGGEALALSGMGILAVARGDPEAAIGPLGEALRLGHLAEDKWVLSSGSWALGSALVALGREPEGRAALTRAASIGDHFGLRWPRARARLAQARLVRGHQAGAEALAHVALREMSETGDLAGMADALEALAGFALDEESFVEAARLLGATDVLRSAVGCVPFSSERGTRERGETAVRAALGEDAFDRAVADGRSLGPEEAVAYAARGRGERRRPSTGWASLTPAERQVAALVASGLTNPQIGEQLFISRRTVQTHLAHIFAKLGVSTRAELAAEVTRRGDVQPAAPPG